MELSGQLDASAALSSGGWESKPVAYSL